MLPSIMRPEPSSPPPRDAYVLVLQHIACEPPAVPAYARALEAVLGPGAIEALLTDFTTNDR